MAHSSDKIRFQVESTVILFHNQTLKPRCFRSGVRKIRFKLKALVIIFHNQILKPGCFRAGVELAPPPLCITRIPTAVPPPVGSGSSATRRLIVGHDKKVNHSIIVYQYRDMYTLYTLYCTGALYAFSHIQCVVGCGGASPRLLETMLF